MKVLTLRSRGRIVVVFGINGPNARLLDCHEAYRQDIEHHLRDGIRYPPGSRLDKFNATPDEGMATLARRITRLFEELLGATCHEAEMLPPIDQEADWSCACRRSVPET